MDLQENATHESRASLCHDEHEDRQGHPEFFL